VSTLRSSQAGRAPQLPSSNSSPKAVPPANWRLAVASVTAVIVSLAADIGLAAAGHAAFTVPAAFTKFSFGSYAPLTVLGIAGATAAWWAVARLSSRPKWLLTRLAVLVTALSLIADVLLLGTAGNPTGPVTFLMLMHLAIGVITYTALVKISPARTGAQAARDDHEPGR
jgi:Family of unknown function (DUF6069)